MKNTKQDKVWYGPALEMFAKTSVWIAAPVLTALFLGKFLDKRYNTAPWIFISLTVLGFTISMIAISKIAIDYIHKLEKEDKNGKSN